MKHKWKPTKLWDKNARACEACELYILNCEMPVFYTNGAPLRSQVSNVLNYDFAGKTLKQIINYAEDDKNKECIGKPGAEWR